MKIRSNRHWRRGTVYLMVLGSALIVAIVGVSAVLAVRVRAVTVRQSHDFAVARECAQAALDVGMYALLITPDWRSSIAPGVWMDEIALGDGVFSLQINDPEDGDLSDDPGDTVMLVGTGVCNAARYGAKVLAAQPLEPLAALGTCLHAGGGVFVEGDVRFDDAPLSSNATVLNLDNIRGDVECAHYGGGGGINGNVDDDADPKDLPDVDVVSKYAALATDISYVTDMVGGVLAPGYSDWGTTDAEGVYYINTKGADLWIEATRILGTLIITTQGGAVYVSWGVYGTPARDDYPVLIVDGDLYVRMYADSGLEESWYSVNYNPPGVPYEGVSDNDTDDFYPSELRGLIHVTGDFEVQAETKLRGVVICGGDAQLSETLRIVHDSGLVDNPPLYYSAYGGLQVIAGSWEQVVESALDNGP